ncbi:uncharacterized protein LOC120678176 [Panicum virgatum]|uniref:uncharacterized protein LOC120678176 n=1 Tax=Panicum virgatum TaxID=38727 RepID=UPI0019D681BD|nr:uncharacterized protein LOC120678176 [Panicum virgatum]
MEVYYNTVRRLEDKFDRLKLNHIVRKYNEEADKLAKFASGRTTVPPNVFARDIAKLSIDFKTPVEATERHPNPRGLRSSSHRPMTPRRRSPKPWTQKPRSPRQMRLRRAKSFALIDDELYKRNPSGILQHCIPVPEGKELIRDIHAGICGHHAVPRTLVGNAFQQGFYWPTIVTDATDVV